MGVSVEGGGGGEGHGAPMHQDTPLIEDVYQEATERGEETGPEAEEEERERGDTDGETPRGATSKVIRVGGGSPPPEKTRIYLTLHHNVHTCCCRKSMKTSLTTTMGHTWMGESRTMLHGSVVGAG